MCTNTCASVRWSGKEARAREGTSEVFEIVTDSLVLSTTHAPNPDLRTRAHLDDASRSVIERVPAQPVELESTCARASVAVGRKVWACKNGFETQRLQMVMELSYARGVGHHVAGAPPLPFACTRAKAATGAHQV